MPIERGPVKDEPEHRINDENPIGTGMRSPFAEARKPRRIAAGQRRRTVSTMASARRSAAR